MSASPVVEARAKAQAAPEAAVAPPSEAAGTPAKKSVDEGTAQEAAEGEADIDADLAIVLGKPKKSVKPTGSLAGLATGRSMLISLEEEGQESGGELSDTSGLNADYDADRIKQAWAKLAQDLREKNKVGLAATLANGDFQFVDPTIRFTVANDVQFEEMKECSTELLHFIRTEVGNGAIALDVQVSEVEAPAEFLTPKDRYMNWAADHPSLEVLRKRLDLDLG